MRDCSVFGLKRGVRPRTAHALAEINKTTEKFAGNAADDYPVDLVKRKSWKVWSGGRRESKLETVG